MNKRISAVIAALMALSSFNAVPHVRAEKSVTDNYKTLTEQRSMEELSRGLVAVRVNNGVYLSWRLLVNESTVNNILTAPDFDVYKNGVKIATVTDSTNYLDTSGKESDVYQVAIENSDELCDFTSVWSNNYLSIPLTNKPADYVVSEQEIYPYIAGDASCGDLDGDGEYELVVKWDANPQDNSRGGVTGNVYLGAYDMDGSNLWLIDLGRNIRSGEHYTQFLVYDFDGDGKAEVTCKTAPGSKDGEGNYVTLSSADSTIKNADNTAEYGNESGYILEGPEYFTVFSGPTGEAIDTIYYPTERVSAQSFGDNYGNRCDRFLADVAYLDGEKPYAVYWRGYYGGREGYSGRTGVFGAALVDGRLQVDYQFDTLSGQPGYTYGNESVIGNGNHNITAADVDGDGKDEVISGSVCMEVNDSNMLAVKWNTKLGHGDALHIGDYDPTNDGFEYFTVHESSPYGMSVINASNGKILDHSNADGDTGRGVMANVGAGGYFQVWSSRCGPRASYGSNEYADIASFGQSMNFRIFWDGDLYEELLDGTSITSYNGSYMETIFTANGCKSVNGTKKVPNLTADLFGDWREEVVYATADSSELRIYTTTDLTHYKLTSLMHDPVYRSGVAAEMSAYNQPPHIGFYLAEEIFKPEVIKLEIESMPYNTIYNIGDLFSYEGLKVRAYYNDNTSELTEGYILTGFDSSSAGKKTVTINYGGMSAEFEIVVETGFVIENGYITGVSNKAAHELIIPEEHDNKLIVGIADGALKDSALKKIVVMGDIEEIGADPFPEGITIVSYEGSFIEQYCEKNNIAFEIIDTADYIINLKYDEIEYNNFSLIQSTITQTQTIDHITYTVGGRSRDGDGYTGFLTTNKDDEICLYAGYGRFGNQNRNAYMTISDTPMLSDNTDYVLEMDFICDDIDGRIAKMTLSDNAGEVDIISSDALGLTPGVRYKYKLVNHKGLYIREIYDSDGELMSKTELVETSSEYGILSIAITNERGSFTNNEHYCGFYIDNFKIYNNPEYTKLKITVTDKAGKPVSRPDIKINETQYKGNINGEVSAEIPSGKVEVKVSAEGYEEISKIFSAHTAEMEKNIAVTAIEKEAEGIRFSKDSIALKAGGRTVERASLIPSDAVGDIEYSSADTSIAEVDSNALITAISEGETQITAKIGEYTAILPVKIYGDYESVATDIKISGPETAYIPQAGISYSDEFTAEVFDQNGVKMDKEVVWSVAPEGTAEISDGIVSIPALINTDRLTVRAQCEEISSDAELILKKVELAYSDIIAQSSFTEDMWLAMTTQDQKKTVGDITYGVGSRSPDGDSTTYVGFDNIDGRNVIAMQAGRFSTNNRNAYMIYDNAPKTYEEGTYYVWESDLFMGGTVHSALSFYDKSGGILYSVTAAEAGIKENEWYNFKLSYKDGVYTQYITDSSGDIISVTNPTVNYNTPIERIDVKAEGVGGYEKFGFIRFADLKYYSSPDFVTNLVIQVIDENGNAIENAVVKTGVIESVTNKFGRAIIPLPVGIYTATAEVNGKTVGSVQIISDGTEKIITLQEKAKDAIEAEGNIVKINVASKDVKVYAASYNDNGSLKSIELITPRSGVYVLNNEPDKIFMWHNDMSSVLMWSKPKENL